MPAVWGAILTPPNRPTLDPYAGPWVALPRTSHGEDAVHPLLERRLRHVEVTIGGFVANDEPIFSRILGGRLFLGKMALSTSWERMYETPPEPWSLSRLDLYRFHLSSNLLGGVARGVEIYPQMGALLMKGKRATWAFDGGLEARIYPWRPLTIFAASIASVFKDGPVLFDTSFEAGVVHDRFELRAGVRWLYQHHAQSFAGPTATIAVRL